MPVSEAQKRANKKWDDEKIDALRIRVKKGMRDVIAQHAQQQGESINAFVNRAVAETIERDKQTE